jgi:sortase (surface protein transpeptidase)
VLAAADWALHEDVLTVPRMVRDRTFNVDRKWWVLGVAVVVIAAGSVIGAQSSTEPGKSSMTTTTAPTTTTTTTTTTKHPVSPTTAIKALKHSVPMGLVIPAIDVATSVGALGLQPDGQIMVPATTRTVGWFKYGPTPGQLGSSTILGHVDSFTGPGVFFNLKNLKPGDSLTVTLADHAVTHFVVTQVVEYSKSTFPDKLVYGPHGTRALNLITCGGTFDRATGHYESNIVVFSRLTSVSRLRRT